eukprot:TRINITY_DN187_c0_g1_i1.p2 TRINITY_DN187_c0_g1~~TRINITY_DN187_c0_g1_i1.p2  ORF type:complete len:221 (-),score=33.01 TRINITY_DN187_c0_g1_i1:849-1427(-)
MSKISQSATRKKLQEFVKLTNVSPFIQIRKILWIITCGWFFFIAYAIAALFMCLTIVYIPLGLKAFEFAIFAFMPIGKEPQLISEEKLIEKYKAESRGRIKKKPRPWELPNHPYTLIGNLIWAFFIGWAIAIMHVVFGILQALTIIGIGNAGQSFLLSLFAVWPFGREIKTVELETKPTNDNNRPEGGTARV